MLWRLRKNPSKQKGIRYIFASASPHSTHLHQPKKKPATHTHTRPSMWGVEEIRVQSGKWFSVVGSRTEKTTAPKKGKENNFSLQNCVTEKRRRRNFQV